MAGDIDTATAIMVRQSSATDCVDVLGDSFGSPLRGGTAITGGDIVLAALRLALS